MRHPGRPGPHPRGKLVDVSGRLPYAVVAYLDAYAREDAIADGSAPASASARANASACDYYQRVQADESGGSAVFGRLQPKLRGDLGKHS
jgi:hypothetical protein